jgi:L-ribulokinase
MENIVKEKLSEDIYPAGTKAGGLTAEMAKRTGLRKGTAVAVGGVDAHVAVPAATVVGPGKMVMIMGTSICHMVVDKEKRAIDGLCGVVKDGILPGYYGYEAGQSAVGDIFGWFVRHAVPSDYQEEANSKGVDIHELLTEKAARLRPAESGLLALDWWNGNRSVLVDADLTGLLIGCTLNTRSEEIYRALIEATAFGTYTIVESLEDGGVPIKELYACGGLPKNKLLMQIYADVSNREIKVAASEQATALGSALWGAVAAGEDAGGYDTIVDAARNMARLKDESFVPDHENHKVYLELFSEYRHLHDLFGRGTDDVMKRLKNLKASVRTAGST